MIKVKTLENCSLMPVESDLWFLHNCTTRDYTIRESKKYCRECGCTQYVKDKYESYCNHCGNIYETRYYNNKTLFGAYGFSYEFIRFLKQESMQLKTIETQIKAIEPDYNKKYRDFKYHYYNLFMEIAMKEYHIHHSKDAEDLFYTMFRAYYEMTKKRGLKRTKVIHKFFDKLNINHRDYFIMGVYQEKSTKKRLGRVVYYKSGNQKIPLYNMGSAGKGDYGYFDDDDFTYQAGVSRVPSTSKGQLNVTGRVFTGRRISYQVFLKVNDYPDTSNIMFKYINRYCEDYTLLDMNDSFTPEDYDRSSVAEPITPVPTLNEDYIPFNSLGLEDMIINTVQYPSRSKYKDLDTMKDNMIQELKKKQPYYSTNLNTYIYTNKPENKHIEQKTENDPQKNTKNKTKIKTIGGTLITERMNKHPYKDRIYPLKITICKKCSKSSRLWITKKHRQYLCTYCKQVKHTINTR